MLFATVSAPSIVPPAAALFEVRRAAVLSKVRAVIAAGRLADPEAAEQTVWLQAWRAWPRMLERAGAGRVHSWDAWFCQIARRVVMDVARGELVCVRLLGRRALVAVGGDVVPLDVDAVVDPVGWGDPEVVVSRLACAEVLGVLPYRQRIAVAAWVEGWTLRVTAARLGVSVVAAKQLRQQGVVALRAYYHRAAAGL